MKQQIDAYEESRRVQELMITGSIKRQTAQGALYQLIFNALMEPRRHLRPSIIELCKRQGYSATKANSALSVMESAGWLKSDAQKLQVVLYLTEYAKAVQGAV